MTAYVELYMDQGTTWNNVIYINDDVSGANINLSSYSVRSQLRRNPYARSAAGNIICEITDTANGEITMSMDSSNTANIKAGRYTFDVELVLGTIIYRILEGIIHVTPENTK